MNTLSAPSSTSSVGSTIGMGGALVGGVGGGAMLQPTTTSAPPTLFTASVGGVAPPSSTNSLVGGAILQPMPTQTGSPLLGNKGGLSSNSSSSFSADFSAIRDLDSISNEIETVRR